MPQFPFGLLSSGFVISFGAFGWDWETIVVFVTCRLSFLGYQATIWGTIVIFVSWYWGPMVGGGTIVSFVNEENVGNLSQCLANFSTVFTCHKISDTKENIRFSVVKICTIFNIPLEGG